MKQNNSNRNNKNQLEEVNKIKQQLIKKYQIYDNYLLEQLATSLLENGIGIEIFNNPFKSKELDLEEIINHLKNKQLTKREEKLIVNIKKNTTNYKIKKKIKTNNRK